MTGYIALYAEAFGLVFNLMTLFLIFRQGLRSPDMHLALLLSMCDIFLVSSRLGLYIYYNGTGNMEIFSNVWFGQLDGLIMCMLVSTSVLCVGYLALLRCWAIFLKKKINIKCWMGFFVAQQGLLVFLLIHVALNRDFKLTPFGRFFYPDTSSKSPSTRVCLFLFPAWIFFSAAAVNVAYPAICYVYIHQIDKVALFLEWRPHVIARRYSFQKVTIVLRICFLLFIYDLVMLPGLYIISKDFITNKIRSEDEDSLVSITMLALAIVNPITLIFLHKDFFDDIKFLARATFHKTLSSFSINQ
ncbi:hypothetical protein DSO57_1024166 [Entomophthora muscae]|uniref:Uncharacterized protein n=1 Tax=Entomophthora muscae TaxID=34485 RepID=A0ACC2RHF9_9FUNG|nr:hypothetical protein DSO57_1024166 [Entomophthora muscae]